MLRDPVSRFLSSFCLSADLRAPSGTTCAIAGQRANPAGLHPLLLHYVTL